MDILKSFFEKHKAQVHVADINNPAEIAALNENETIICVQPFELHVFDFGAFKHTGKLSAYWLWEFKSLPDVFRNTRLIST